MYPYCETVQQASCLTNIITLNDPCTPLEMRAGQLDIAALYPDFAWSKVDSITDRPTALEELKAVRWIATQKVSEDIRTMAAKVGIEINGSVGAYYDTGMADCKCTAPELPDGLSAYRGVKISVVACNVYASMKRVHISRLLLYSKANYNSVILLIKDNGFEYNITVPNVTIGVNDVLLKTGRVGLVSEGSSIEILVNSADYPDLCITDQFCFCSLKLKAGEKHLNFNTFDGYSYKAGKGLKGFGIVATAGVVCNSDALLCIMAGQQKAVAYLILYQMGVLLAEKTLTTTRINPFVVFRKEEAETTREKYLKLYVEKYNDVLMLIKNTLKNMDGDCIVCKGTKILTNV